MSALRLFNISCVRPLALFLTGLCLLAVTVAPLSAEGLNTPSQGRSVVRATPTRIPTAIPEVSKQDLGRLKKEIQTQSRKMLDDAQAKVRELKKRHESLRENLFQIQKKMREALAKEQAQAAYEKEKKKQQEEHLNKIEEDLKHLGSLKESLQKSKAKLLRQDDDIAALNDTVKALQKSLSKELGEVREFRDDFTAKADRLEGVIDLMNAMRKDIYDNSKGLVDLQNELSEMKRPLEEKGASTWLDRIMRWPYMPAVAVSLSAVAVGLAASK